MKHPISNSSSGLVNYITDRSDSFSKTYLVLKNMMTGKSDLSFNVYSSNGDEITVGSESIYETLSPIISEEKHSVKVWPTFKLGEYFPISNNDIEYDNISLGSFSLIRLNELNEDIHYITIDASSSNSAVVFIVLDRGVVDGKMFEFKVDFINNNLNTLPVVEFIDGSYSNIEISNNGKYINIDGIDYEYFNKNNISFNYKKYNNKEFLNTLGDNESVLVSVRNGNQIFNKKYGTSKEIKLKYLNEVKYSNFGLFDSEHIKTYQNDDIVFTCKSLLDPKKLKNLIISNNQNGVKFSTTSGQMYIIGADDYRNSESAYNAYSFGSRLMSGKNVELILGNYPDQLMIPVVGNTTLSFTIKYNNTSDSVICHKIGVSKTNINCVVRKSLSVIEAYVDDSSSGAPTVSKNNSSVEINYVVGFKNKADGTYIRLHANDGNIVLFDIEGKSSDYSKNLKPYLQTYLVNPNVTSKLEYSFEISNYKITHNLDSIGINGIFNFTNKDHISQDLDNTNTPLDSKVLPFNMIEGHILSLNNRNKLQLPMSDLQKQQISNLSYRASFVYNKHKGNFLYVPSKKYLLDSSLKYNQLVFNSNCILSKPITTTVITKEDRVLNVECVDTNNLESYNNSAGGYRSFTYNNGIYECLIFYPSTNTIVTSENSEALNSPVGSTVNSYDTIKVLNNSNIKLDLTFEISAYYDTSYINNTYSLYYVDNNNKLVYIKDYIITNNMLTTIGISKVFTLADTVENIDIGTNIETINQTNVSKHTHDLLVGGFVILHKLEENEYPTSFYSSSTIKKINSKLTIIDNYVSETTSIVNATPDYSVGTNKSIFFGRCNVKKVTNNVYTNEIQNIVINDGTYAAKKYVASAKPNDYMVSILNNTGPNTLTKIQNNDFVEYVEYNFIRTPADEIEAEMLMVPQNEEYNVAEVMCPITTNYRTMNEHYIVNMYFDILFNSKLEIDISNFTNTKKMTHIDYTNGADAYSTSMLSPFLDFGTLDIVMLKDYKEAIFTNNFDEKTILLQSMTVNQINYKNGDTYVSFTRGKCGPYLKFKNGVPNSKILECKGINVNLELNVTSLASASDIQKYSKFGFAYRIRKTKQSDLYNIATYSHITEPMSSFYEYSLDFDLFKSSTVSGLNGSYVFNTNLSSNVKTGTVDEYVKVPNPLDPEIIETTSPIENIKINYITLNSGYISQYRDSNVNSSSWKLFGYYQLPINN